MCICQVLTVFQNLPADTAAAMETTRKQVMSIFSSSVAAGDKTEVAGARPNPFGGGLAGLGGIKLRKTHTVERTMFKKTEGQVTNTASATSAATTAGPKDKDKRTSLSKLVDFPGDVSEVTKHLEVSMYIHVHVYEEVCTVRCLTAYRLYIFMYASIC